MKDVKKGFQVKSHDGSIEFVEWHEVYPGEGSTISASEVGRVFESYSGRITLTKRVGIRLSVILATATFEALIFSAMYEATSSVLRSLLLCVIISVAPVLMFKFAPRGRVG